MRIVIFKEIIQMAFHTLRNHKLRSFLTLLGIMIGVMTVIGMVSVIQGLNRTFISELESIGADVIIIKKTSPIETMKHTESERTRKDITLEDAEALERECKTIKGVALNLATNIFENIPVKYHNTKTHDAIILGMNEKFPRILSVYYPVEGRFFIEADVIHRTKVCVLGSELNDILFPHTQAVGKKIRIGPEKFRVIGVLAKRGSMFGQSQDNIIGIPITTLMKYFPYNLSELELTTAPKEHEKLEDALEEITNILRKRRKIPFGKPNDFHISTQGSILELYNEITGAVFLVMIFISSIGLLVGGIGVMNVMLVSAKERIREIGIRKAIGARSSDILNQFLVEAVFLTGTGGILGILMGAAIALIVRTATPLPASVTLWSVLLGLFVSITVGLFFGIYPARRAAKFDPIISLRYE